MQNSGGPATGGYAQLGYDPNQYGSEVAPFSAAQGVVSFLADPDHQATITDAWCQDILSLRPAKPLHVRAGITTAADGRFPTDLYRRALDRYANHQIPVSAVVGPQLAPSAPKAGWHPNMALNTTGNKLLSPYIDAWTLRVMAVARQLVAHGLHTYWCGNEPNLSAMLAEGVQAPPGDKAGALSPAVCAATCWQAAHRLKSVGVKTVYNGSLSLLPFTGLDPHNGYYAAYVEAFYAALASRGEHAPWPWDGWGLNAEGAWSASQFTRAVDVLRGIMARHGDTGKIVIGEWSWQNGNAVDAVKARTTFDALSGAVDLMHFFQHPLRLPNDFRDYGATGWRLDGTSFVPSGEKTAWWPILVGLYGDAVAE